MTRNEQISIHAGRAVEKLALDILARKSTERILVEFNTKTHAFMVSPIRVSDKSAPAAGVLARAWHLIDEALKDIAHDVKKREMYQPPKPPYTYLSEIIDQLALSGKTRQWAEVRKLRGQVDAMLRPGVRPESDQDILDALGRATPVSALCRSHREVVKDATDRLRSDLINSQAAYMADAIRATEPETAPPVADAALEKAHAALDTPEPPKCSDKPIYYFASNDYKAVQAWAEEHGLPDWNRAAEGFDYPPNAVVVFSFCRDGGSTTELERVVKDALVRGVAVESIHKVGRQLTINALFSQILSHWWGQEIKL